MTQGDADLEAVEAINVELTVLDRLIYRYRSQHRNAKYFCLLLEVKRACKVLAAPKIPGLLEEGLGMLGRIPDCRNGRARETWIRSASCGLRRSRSAIIACAATLEAIVKASRHLAHQVSQTYFMPLSVTFLACVSRVFACNIHLGGRLLEVHGALLRAMLAQPSTSDCLSASAVAACRLPEENKSFLEFFRNGGEGLHDRYKVKSSSAAAVALSPRATTPTHSAASGLGEPDRASPTLGGNIGDGVEGSGGTNADDTGVRVGRVTVKSSPEGEIVSSKFLQTLSGDATVSYNEVRAVDTRTCTGMKTLPKQGRPDTCARGQEEDSSAGADAGCDGGLSARIRERTLPPKNKKLVLATEFSDSSDDEHGDGDADRRPLLSEAKSPKSAQTDKKGSSKSPNLPEIKQTKSSGEIQPTIASDIGNVLAPVVRASSPDGVGDGKDYHRKDDPPDSRSKTSIVQPFIAVDVPYETARTLRDASISISKSSREGHAFQGCFGGSSERSLDKRGATLAKTVMTVTSSTHLSDNGEAALPRNEAMHPAEVVGSVPRHKPHDFQKDPGGAKRLSNKDRQGKRKRGKKTDEHATGGRGKRASKRNAIDDIFGSL